MEAQHGPVGADAAAGDKGADLELQRVDSGTGKDSDTEVPCEDLDSAVGDMNAASAQAVNFHQLPLLLRALSRMPALLVTLVIELLVAFNISSYTDTFKRYPLLIAFQPVISAISGNVGLQTMATVTRGLALSLFSGTRICQGTRHELGTGLAVAGLLGTVVAAVAYTWYFLADASHTTKGALAFALAIFLGQFASILCASLTATLAPLLFSRLGWDPANMGGPLETAFQDVVGSTAMLAAAAAILQGLGDFAEACPGDDIFGCVQSCHLSGTMYSEQCLQHCAKLSKEGLC
ncbi:mgtE [Symbiodinium natans]|uniref:MgtE protein n=1 Tax=Symbiodinium natans TaxID=878477 RepID=A0A812P1Q3_9DINO|nr:mgtE [Symbiodinium natans]